MQVATSLDLNLSFIDGYLIEYSDGIKIKTQLHSFQATLTMEYGKTDVTLSPQAHHYQIGDHVLVHWRDGMHYLGKVRKVGADANISSPAL